MKTPSILINESYMDESDPVVKREMRRAGFSPPSTPHDGDSDMEAQINKYMNEMIVGLPLTQETMDRIKMEFVNIGLNPNDFTARFDKDSGELVIKRKEKFEGEKVK